MAENVDLVPVDGVEVTVVMDNAIDILAAPSETAVRPMAVGWSEGDQLRAEHGYSLVVTVHNDGATDTILYDAGLSRDGTIHNLDVLGIQPKEDGADLPDCGVQFGVLEGSATARGIHHPAWRQAYYDLTAMM